MIGDAFDLGCGALQSTSLTNSQQRAHPRCQGHFFNKTQAFMLFVVTAVFHSAATEIIVQVVFTFTTDSFQHREEEKEIKRTFWTENRNDSLAFNGLSG